MTADDKAENCDSPPPYEKLQDLPPQAAHFCLGVANFCRKSLNWQCGGQSVLVAYSGGADSKALLLALHYLAPRLKITLHAATLDHGLRPEAKQEVREAEAFCAAFGITFHTDVSNVAAFASENGIGLEEAGRKARLAFFTSVLQETDCAWVALGHHLNDLAEDSFMRMLRGSGWPALAGMVGLDAAHRLVRPLLLTPRESIESFLRGLGQTWHEDSMNMDDAFLRNRVRKYVLPLFLQENPSFLNTVADRWHMARQDERHFSSLMNALPETSEDGAVFIARIALEATSPAVRLRKYRSVLRDLGTGQVCATLLQALDAAWQRNEGGKTVQFSGGKKARIKNGGILFCCGKTSCKLHPPH